MIENSDRGITLNKGLAWTMATGFLAGGVWIGTSITDVSRSLEALTGAFVNVAYPLTIGAEYNTDIAGDYRRFFNGRMSKVRFVHSALYAA